MRDTSALLVVIIHCNLAILSAAIAKKSNIETAQNTKQYPDIIWGIWKITDSNREEKLIKAVKAAAKQMQLPVGVAKEEPKGEKHLYPIREELHEAWANFYTSLLDELYSSITAVFDLPAVSVETVKKFAGVLHFQKSLFSKKNIFRFCKWSVCSPLKV